MITKIKITTALTIYKCIKGRTVKWKNRHRHKIIGRNFRIVKLNQPYSLL